MSEAPPAPVTEFQRVYATVQANPTAFANWEAVLAVVNREVCARMCV